MTTALDSFRNPPLDLGITPLVGGDDIANITGDASECGMPDVYGNIAYFNKLCVGTVNGGVIGNLEWARLRLFGGSWTVPPQTLTVANYSQADLSNGIGTVVADGITAAKDGIYLVSVSAIVSGTIPANALLSVIPALDQASDSSNTIYLSSNLPASILSGSTTKLFIVNAGQVIGALLNTNGSTGSFSITVTLDIVYIASFHQSTLDPGNGGNPQ